MKDDQIIQYGIPPNRLDLISSIEGVEFVECWENKTIVSIVSEEASEEELEIPFIGFDQLIKNKKSTGRRKDANDVFYLTKYKK